MKRKKKEKEIIRILENKITVHCFKIPSISKIIQVYLQIRERIKQNNKMVIFPWKIRTHEKDRTLCKTGKKKK